jgi:phosphoglycerol transferase MdoB-like AlkP superfamily enzyme
MTRFIGRDDIEEPKFMDDVWGVSDEDLFNQSVKELNLLAKSGKPFYAVIQTLSNHTPFSLPDPLPVKKVEGLGQVSEHLTAMRYSDWALGKFFRDIEHSPIMDNTLFIVVGDHGFGSKKIHSAVDLGRFRVPMLIIAPDIQHYFGHYNDRVASQVDLVPTAMALLGQPFQHQCWGRDLLGLKKDDPGLAVIKPSGSDQTNAIIIGDDIVTLSPETPAELGRLSFEPALAWQKRNDPAQEAQLAEQLKGYVQTALNALYSGNVSGGGQTYSAAPSAASDSSEI